MQFFPMVKSDIIWGANIKTSISIVILQEARLEAAHMQASGSLTS